MISYPAYVLQHLEALSKSNDKKAVKHQVRLLLYFSHLATLQRAGGSLKTVEIDSEFGKRFTSSSSCLKSLTLNPASPPFPLQALS